MCSADQVMKPINHLIDISWQNFSFLFIYSNIFLYFKLITLSPFTTYRCWFTYLKNVFRRNRADLRTCYFMLKDVIWQSIQLVCKQPTTTHSTLTKKFLIAQTFCETNSRSSVPRNYPLRSEVIKAVYMIYSSYWDAQLNKLLRFYGSQKFTAVFTEVWN